MEDAEANRNMAKLVAILRNFDYSKELKIVVNKDWLEMKDEADLLFDRIKVEYV